MADKAHYQTDLKLEEMEKRLSAIYSRAGNEIQKTADEYFSKFAKQDEAKRKLLEQGKITEEEYAKWRKGKVMYGKRFTEMKEQCAKQLLNVNQTALAYVNGELPEVYALNYNAIESAVDGVGGYGDDNEGGEGGGSVPKPLTFDYMPEGYPTKSVQTTTLMEEQELAFTLGDGFYVAQITNAFKIVNGQTYTVNWDGTEYECVGVGEDSYVIGNLSIAGIGDDTGEPFVYGYDARQAVGTFLTLDTAASHTISVKTTEETVTPIAEEYLPDTVATKSEVESTQKVLDGVFSSVATFTFDKQTSGRDTFNFNGFNFYKISDFNPAPENVISFKGTKENGGESSKITIGSNCVGYGFFIVVASAGHCSLPVTETVTYSFIAPSAGLYAQYEVDNTDQTAGTGEFTLRASTGSSYITGLLLRSSTTDSTKKFKITVDDSGALKATEI